jgi:phosphonoacetate hydrolase
MVPFIVSHALKPDYAARLAGDPRNFDIFDFTVNGTLRSSGAAESRSAP